MELTSRNATVASIFEKGLQAHNAGDLSSAEQLYKETLAIQPNHCEANHNIGMVLAAKNDLDKALKFFKYALDTSPNVSLFWASYIDVLIKLDRITESKTLIKAVKDAGIHCEKIETISKLLSVEYQDPGPKDAQKLAELIEAQKFDDAIKTCLNLMDTYPNSAVLNINLGKCYFELGQIEPAIASYKIATEYQPKWAASFIMLGQLYSSQEDPEQAVNYFKKAIDLQPGDTDLLAALGAELLKNNKEKEAIDSYRQVIKMKPNDASVGHILAALTEQQTATAPNEYIERLFDAYAVNFDLSLINHLKYKIPKLITDLIIGNHSGNSLKSVLDLGCGTGLAGLELKSFCKNIEGIDLSKKMLAQARKKNIYNKLSHIGILEYLADAPLDFDLFLSLDVFIYVGDLSEVFRLIKSRNKQKGQLAFSTEHKEKDGFSLETSGRYSHSKSYIESLCEEFNYQVLHFSKTNLRKDKGTFLTGGLYLLEF